jgi:hypothetical protein
VDLRGVDQLCSLDAQLVKRDRAEVDETKVCGWVQNAVNHAVHLEFREWLESGIEGEIMEDRLHESAVQCRASVERRDEETGIVGYWTEAGIAFGVCVELAAAEGEVVDTVQL